MKHIKFWEFIFISPFVYVFMGLFSVPFLLANSYVATHIWEWYKPEWLPLISFSEFFGVFLLVSLHRILNAKNEKVEKIAPTWVWMGCQCIAILIIYTIAYFCKGML